MYYTIGLCWLSILNIAVLDGQKARHQKIHKQMMERVWRKENPLTLLVGMQTGVATMENSVEIL